MYINRAYLGEQHADISSSALPLLITAVGHFRVHSKGTHKTSRENGREDYQLIYVAEGKVHLQKDGREQIIQRGNMILFRPHEPQNYSLFAKDKPETYWVHFTGNDVEALLAENSIRSEINVFYTGVSDNYKWLFRKMIQELQLKRTGFAEMLSVQLRQLLIYIGRNVKEGALVTADLLDEIEQAMHYFDKNFYQPIIIEDYARQHHMTPCWFIQSFKKIAQVTPTQYILSLRINNAIHLLDSTDYPVSKIANLAGYDNALYFSRLFKKHTGYSPRDFRKLKKS